MRSTNSARRWVRVADPRKAPSGSDVSGAIGDIDYINRALDDKFPKGPARPDPVARYQRELLDIKARLKTLAASSKEKLDPPIESISHQVQFVVALTGDISPNWTLVRFKGPTLQRLIGIGCQDQNAHPGDRAG